MATTKKKRAINRKTPNRRRLLMRNNNSKLNKSAFVRGFADDVKAADVVAAAKKRGIKLDARYVYVIRSNAHKKANGKGGHSRKPRLSSATAPVTTDRAEVGVRQAIAHLGVDRVQQLCHEVLDASA